MVTTIREAATLAFRMTTLGIVGFGNFGRFMCNHLRPRFNIRVHDRLDIADEAAQIGVKSAPLPEVAASEILVLAVPVQNMEEVLRDLRGVPRLPELVMDVGSVKVKPLDLMARYLPKRVDIVGTHPDVRAAERPSRHRRAQGRALPAAHASGSPASATSSRARCGSRCSR